MDLKLIKNVDKSIELLWGSFILFILYNLILLSYSSDFYNNHYYIIGSFLGRVLKYYLFIFFLIKYIKKHKNWVRIVYLIIYIFLGLSAFLNFIVFFSDFKIISIIIMIINIFQLIALILLFLPSTSKWFKKNENNQYDVKKYICCNCGTKVSKNDKFCPNCGKEFEED